MNVERIAEALKGAGLPADLVKNKAFLAVAALNEELIQQAPIYKAPDDMRRLWQEFEELKRTMLKVIKDLGPRKPWWRLW